MITQFSQQFEHDLLEEISHIPPAEIPRNTVILREQSYIKEIPLVVRGNIKVRKTDETGKEIILYHIEAGESCILSITSCLNDKKSQAEAITDETTQLIIVPASKVKEWMDTYKSWRKFVLSLYNARLTELLMLVDNISFNQTDSRLYKKLKDLQNKQGNAISITHQQLAYEIGTAREVISRLLKQMEKEEFIKLERGKIKILRPL
ncbi:MAG: Crp/Fnr family transcriptional regulator [Bacteroidales bacterium]|nr:Crp/Fnr family transcriptional regulator [Bacteroidales bacterium]